MKAKVSISSTNTKISRKFSSVNNVVSTWSRKNTDNANLSRKNSINSNSKIPSDYELDLDLEIENNKKLIPNQTFIEKDDDEIF